MDGAVVAAFVTGAFLVVTYAATEVLKVVNTARIARAAATRELLDALDQAGRREVRWMARWLPSRAAILAVASRGMGLVPYISKRDHDMVYWIGMLAGEALEAPRQEDRIRLLARMTAVVHVWAADRRLGRRAVAEDRDAIVAYVDRVEAAS